eukprot:g3365.t1
MMMAVEAVNNHASVLPTAELRLVSVDGQCCDTEPSLRAFLSLTGRLGPGLGSGPGISGVLGPLCSGAAQDVARLAQFFNVVQVSSTATAMRLSDKQSFPYFLRTASTDAETLDGWVSLCDYYGWRDIVMTVQSGDEYSLEMAESFERRVDRYNAEQAASGSGKVLRRTRLSPVAFGSGFDQSISTSLTGGISPTELGDALRSGKNRLVATFMYNGDGLAKVLCDAYKAN